MRAIVLLLFLGLLTACVPRSVTVGLRFGFELSPVITRFEPDRGEGASYQVGESVRFLISLSRTGYITLAALDADGVAYEFDRVFLGAGTCLLYTSDAADE